MINNVACFILYHFLNLNVRVHGEGNGSDGHDDVKLFLKGLSEKRTICYAPELIGAESIYGSYLGAHWDDFMSCLSNGEFCSKRLAYFFLHIFSLFFKCKLHCRLYTV